MTDMRQFHGEASINQVNHMRYTKQQHQSCKYCGGNHQHGREHCPAYGSLCARCNRRNHWKIVCTASENPDNEYETSSGQAYRGANTRKRSKSKSRYESSRSYNVQSPCGNVLRRNRRHIRETSESHAGSHQQDDNPAPNEPEQQTQTTVEPAQTTVQPVTPVSQIQPSKKTVRFEDSAECTSSGRRVKPPRRLDL